MFDRPAEFFPSGDSTAGEDSPSLSRIALIGNFLPRLCGVATFTTHVFGALRAECPRTAVDVYAMVDPGRSYAFPDAVTAAIDQEDRASYHRAARGIEASGARIVWVQHEYGIFGGPAGEYLLDLLDRVSAPVALTLHTVLEAPNADQRRVLERLIARASLLIVMAERARATLQHVYGAPLAKIALIEHGVPDRDYVEPSAARHCFGMEDRKTILTFGLLSPDKGVETMIRAMPRILERCPEALYRIVGATHPHLVAHQGERYRESLEALARELGVERHLHWENRFLDEDELLNRISAADVYVTPYLNPQQITSGTLSYAAALGKPVVATPYVHATELLAHGRGLLVDFNDSAAMADAVGDLLVDDGLRAALAARVHAHGRTMTWARLAKRAMARFDTLARAHTAPGHAASRAVVMFRREPVAMESYA